MNRQHYALGLATGTYRGQPFINRQPLPFHPDTADFSDFGDCVLLSSIGIFAINRTAHRAKRSLELREELMFDAAYHALGLDRKREHNRIAARLETARSLTSCTREDCAVLDIFDELDPDFPPEEDHDYDKPVAEVEETLLSWRERVAVHHPGWAKGR